MSSQLCYILSSSNFVFCVKWTTNRVIHASNFNFNFLQYDNRGGRGNDRGGYGGNSGRGLKII